ITSAPRPTASRSPGWRRRKRRSGGRVAAAEGQDLEGLDHAAAFVRFGGKGCPGALESGPRKRRMLGENVAQPLRPQVRDEPVERTVGDGQRPAVRNRL